MDLHAASIVVVWIVDGAKPQPPEMFKLAGILAWARAELVMEPPSGFEMVWAD